MSKFTVRVELFGKASNDDYDLLHENMQSKRYLRVIKGDDSWYHLPSATYTAEKDTSTEAVRDEVADIAASVWSDSGVFVTKAEDGRFWHSLRKASAHEVDRLTG
jgi:hypothetical protein